MKRRRGFTGFLLHFLPIFECFLEELVYLKPLESRKQECNVKTSRQAELVYTSIRCFDTIKPAYSLTKHTFPSQIQTTTTVNCYPKLIH